MNPFLFSLIALCVAQGAVAQYGQSSYGGHNNQMAGYQQRKMSPSPQQYGSAGAYQQQRQAYAPAAYEQQSYEQPAAYRAPSSASVSSYDERTPASGSYAKQASYMRPQSYAGQQQQSSYGAAAPAAYAKAAPKYEEPSYPPMPFAWGYDINDGYGGAQYHKENGDEYGKRTGSYGYTDAYGIYRQVDYVADEHGFRATIKTNEPGVGKGAESPADVELHAYEPPSNYYAGNTDSYGSGKQSAYGQQQNAYNNNNKAQSYSAPRAAYQQQTEQYSSSAIVPTYQKMAGAARRY